MLKIKTYQLFALFVCSILFSACAGLNTGTSSDSKAENVNTTANTQTENTGEKVADDKPKANAGVCQNEYYPINTEIKREYKSSTGQAGNLVVTQIKNEGNTFTEKRVTGGGTTLTLNWICTEEGLRHAEYNSGADFSGGKFKMETLESSGVTIPKVWEVGKKWSAEYKVNANLNVGKVSKGMGGTIKINNERVSLDEKVTTPAGEFEAAKVVSDVIIDLNMEKAMTSKMTNWYARDVGLVKQVLDSPFGSGITTEYVGEVR